MPNTIAFVLVVATKAGVGCISQWAWWRKTIVHVFLPMTEIKRKFLRCNGTGRCLNTDLRHGFARRRVVAHDWNCERFLFRLCLVSLVWFLCWLMFCESFWRKIIDSFSIKQGNMVVNIDIYKSKTFIISIVYFISIGLDIGENMMI